MIGGEERKMTRTAQCCCVALKLDAEGDQIGVAVGGFADRDFPAPTRSVWEQSRHGWVGFAHDLPRFERQRPPR
jgi:hypothetical protein